MLSAKLGRRQTCEPPIHPPFAHVKRQYLERRPKLQRVYLTLTNVTPYAEVASGLDIQIIDEPAVSIGAASYRSLSLDMGERSVDRWLTRLAAAELGAEQDGLLDERQELWWYTDGVLFSPEKSST